MHKTYPEVRNLKTGELLWHYYNAVKRLEEEAEEKNSTLEFYMSVINPPMYKEYIKRKNNPVTEVATYKEDMTEEDFQIVASMAHKRFSPEMLEKAKKRADNQKSNTGLPISHRDLGPAGVASSFNSSDPSKWIRPAGVPPMRKIDDLPEQSIDEETDINPIIFEKRKP